MDAYKYIYTCPICKIMLFEDIYYHDKCCPKCCKWNYHVLMTCHLISDIDERIGDLFEMPRNNNWGTVDVSLAWDNALGAYNLRFGSTNQWDAIQGVITFIKQTIPWNERDYTPETKTWGIHEKHADNLKIMLENIRVFKFVFIKKPDNAQSFASSNLIHVDKYKKIFKDITNNDITDDYAACKSIYRKACLRLHPDRNPNNAQIAQQMSSLNEAWFNLEVAHFKVKEFAKQQ